MIKPNNNQPLRGAEGQTENKMKALITALAASAMLTACASQPYTPVIDHVNGQNMTTYNDDLAACHLLASQRMSAMQGAGAGAIAGALLGGAIMAALGGNSEDIVQVAGATAIGGAVGGAAEGLNNTASIVNNCMSGRGYRVL